jgi:hypothetical protein
MTCFYAFVGILGIIILTMWRIGDDPEIELNDLDRYDSMMKSQFDNPSSDQNIYQATKCKNLEENINTRLNRISIVGIIFAIFNGVVLLYSIVCGLISKKDDFCDKNGIYKAHIFWMFMLSIPIYVNVLSLLDFRLDLNCKYFS